MPHDSQPYYLPHPQQYAVEQERYRHDQALYSFGEYSLFLLMWKIQDFEKGLVGRCPTCFLAYGKIAEAYGQASSSVCPDCLGTTFDGGYKAKIIRPAIWDDTSARANSLTRSGEVETDSTAIQSTNDFRMHTDDYVFRADGSCWQVQDYIESMLNTGFQHMNAQRGLVGVNYNRVKLEDSLTVAYSAVSMEDVITILNPEPEHFPIDFSAQEEIKGPIL